jgi:hypothetical protein
MEKSLPAVLSTREVNGCHLVLSELELSGLWSGLVW